MHLDIGLEASLSKAFPVKFVFTIPVWQLISRSYGSSVTNLYILYNLVTDLNED